MLGLAVGALLAPFWAAASEPAADHRAWQHGIDLLRVGEKTLLVWGSPGNPPRANPGGDWQHDIYYAWLTASPTRESVLRAAQILVAAPEAQEPPSMAINARGNLLLTSEDGNAGINQQAGLWDSDLRPLRNYPFLIKRGGHSGHVAASGDRFLVVYGEGWVERGGFLDAGTGKTIHARVVEGDGRVRQESTIAAGHRDGWPLVAASGHNWLVVWQRYPGLTLHMALVDAAGKTQRQAQIGKDMPVRYAYDVEYAPELASYVVAGSSGDAGFVALVNLAGEVINTRHGLPPLASESRVIIGHVGSELVAVYPVRPSGVAVVRLTAERIELLKVVANPYVWDYSGTTGAFTAPDRVVFYTLSQSGLQVIAIDL
jgi:hypothetical protein